MITRKEAQQLLSEHVKDQYQLFHVNMVAKCMGAYAEKYNADPDLWYITGLLHDLDYDQHPGEHPKKAIEWFKEWNYPEEMINAIGFHAPSLQDQYDSSSILAQALLAIDELTGVMYAYALMRPEGFKGMKAGKLNKKFKDKAFAAKVDREVVKQGVDLLGIDMIDHMQNLLVLFQDLEVKRFN